MNRKIFIARVLFFLSGINFAFSGIRVGYQDFIGVAFNLFAAIFGIYVARNLIKKAKKEESK